MSTYSHSIHRAIIFLIATFALFCCKAGELQASTASATSSSSTVATSPVFPYSTVAATQMSAHYNGTDLFIAANDGTGTEMCYWFKWCMSNKLFTFSRVGYRNVNRTGSSTAGISTDTSITWLNKTISDNIGPVSIEGYYNFVGGNHFWQEKDAEGRAGKGQITNVRTATCDAVEISIDGRQLSKGQEVSCQSVTVDVSNTIFNPLVPPKNNSSVLSSPLISEKVKYVIIGNSIDVTVTHTYNRNIKVRRYYGMQSMFVDETTIYTPCGPYPEGTTPKNNLTFKKGTCPLFNRFIEMNADGWCQSAWMELKGLGQHALINDQDPIFTRGTNKSYHILLFNSAVNANTPYYWHGVYTWTKPLVKDDSIFAYLGYINGNHVIYIDVLKKVKDYRITLPEAWVDFKVLERLGDIRTSIDGTTISITANSDGMIILANRYYPVAVDDITVTPRTIADTWTDMHGCTMNTQPTTPGIYIHNGKKVVINK